MAFGITGEYVATNTIRKFEAPISQRKQTIAALPDNSITLIRFYDHGAPGMLGEDDAESLTAMLRSKMRENGQIHLLGCSTAGADAHLWNPVGGWGLYLRMAMYNGIPKMMGEDDIASKWTENLARDVSRMIPNTYVLGLGGISFPLSRLLFSAEGYAPSALMADRFVYRNSKLTKMP